MKAHQQGTQKVNPSSLVSQVWRAVHEKPPQNRLGTCPILYCVCTTNNSVASLSLTTKPPSRRTRMSVNWCYRSLLLLLSPVHSVACTNLALSSIRFYLVRIENRISSCAWSWDGIVVALTQRAKPVHVEGAWRCFGESQKHALLMKPPSRPLLISEWSLHYSYWRVFAAWSRGCIVLEKKNSLTWCLQIVFAFFFLSRLV